jgi:hypothetical protein
MNGCTLSFALKEKLPGAIITRRVERAWHSMSFSGKRLLLELKVADDRDVAGFSTTIGDYEFSLPGQLVADIVIVEQCRITDGVLLKVEALLLDDEN